MEKYVDFSLDINGKKHMVVQLGIRTVAIKHGFQYSPRLFLAIRGEKVADLSGTVKVTEKKDVTLCEINLNFSTKKLNLKVTGHTSRGLASWEGRVTVAYKFVGGVLQNVTVELRVGNTSSKSLTQYRGNLIVSSSAYSSLNFESAIEYQVLNTITRQF